jgi:hypothetical protein
MSLRIEITLDGPLPTVKAQVYVDGELIGFLTHLSFLAQTPLEDPGNVKLEIRQIEWRPHMKTRIVDLREQFPGVVFEMVEMPSPMDRIRDGLDPGD